MIKKFYIIFITLSISLSLIACSDSSSSSSSSSDSVLDLTDAQKAGLNQLNGLSMIGSSSL